MINWIRNKAKFIKRLFYPKFFYKYNRELVRSICPICRQDNSNIILRINDINIVECCNCKNARTLPEPKLIKYEDESFHQNLSIQSIDKLPNQWKHSISLQLQSIRKNIPAKGKVLEIGCGSGLLLNEIKNLGYKTNGIEPSRHEAEMAKQRGLEVIKGYFPSNMILDQKFDLVIASHVLEHISDTKKFIESVKGVLTDEGKILFVQTNWTGIMPRYQKENWHGWAIDQHYWHFSPEGLIFLLSSLGLKVIELKYSSLEHNSKLMSRISMLYPKKFDQFQLLVSLDK